MTFADQGSLLCDWKIGEHRATLRLFPDPDRRSRALGHFHGQAVEHLDASTPPELRQSLGRLGKALASLPARPVALESAFDELTATAQAISPGGSLEPRRWIHPAQTVPHWPDPVRLPPSSTAGAALWPFDLERVGLMLGTRRLIKREHWASDPIENEIAELTRDGFVVRVPPASPGQMHRVLLAAKDGDFLDEAVRIEAASRSSELEWADATRWMGRALGYPECCIEAHLELRKRDDLWQAAHRLPPLSHSAAPAESQWLNGALRLVSHIPCSLWCAPTIELARRLCEAEDQARPGFSRQWRDLARRLHVLDTEGRYLALVADGELGEGPRVLDAIELRPPSGRASDDIVLGRPDLRGESIVFEGRFPVMRVGSHRSTLIADHGAEHP